MVYQGVIPNSDLRIAFEASDVTAVIEQDVDIDDQLNGHELPKYRACQVWFRSGLRLLLDDKERTVLDDVTAAMKGYPPEER